MIEQEIPREQWPRFCEAFSREHHGWLATVEVTETRLLRHAWPEPARALVRDAVFRRLGLESEAGEARIALETERPGSVHHAARPQRMFLEETEEGAHAGLRVDMADGRSYLVAFRAAARPEELDGLSEFE